jgi:hypothetical protein
MILEQCVSTAGIVWNACCLALNELSKKGKFDVVGHDVGGSLDVAALHEKF